jgi:hypothetical protein
VHLAPPLQEKNKLGWETSLRKGKQVLGVLKLKDLKEK